MYKFILIFFLIAAPVSAQGEETPLFRSLGIVYTTLSVIDAAQTSYALGHGGMRELNPIMRPIADKPEILATVKITIPLFVNYGTSQMWKTDKHSALAMRILFVVIQGAVVAWNIHQLNKIR
jgi:hypothetical protein